MTRRDELINMLKCSCSDKCQAIDDSQWSPDTIADFILAEQAKAVKEVVEPLEETTGVDCDILFASVKIRESLSKAREYTEGI